MPPQTVGSNDNVSKGLLITLIGGLLFTFDLPLLRLADGEKWSLIFARGMLMFLAISAVWLAQRQSSGSRAPFIAGFAGLVVCGTSTIANISFIGAIVETSAANVVFITALIPVLTAVMARFFIGETVPAWTWLATGVALTGVSIIVWDGIGHGTVRGDLLALLSALCTAFAFTVIRASGKNLITSLAIGSLSAAMIAFMFFGASPSGLGSDGWFWVAVNGLLVIPIATTLMAMGPRLLPSADVSMFFLLETTLTPVWIWLIFGEMPGRGAMIGGAIVIAALLAHSCWRFMSSMRSGTPAGA
jgi:drug/metabolite transporter (DMT)-like permease